MKRRRVEKDSEQTKSQEEGAERTDKQVALLSRNAL